MPGRVLVVGAGLGGTAVSAFLARFDVPVTVLDRRPGPSDRPRSRMLTAESMELLREFGEATATDPGGRIRALGRPGPIDFRVVTSLVDAGRVVAPTQPPTESVAVQCDQDLVEGVLRSTAQNLGAVFAWNSRVDDLREVLHDASFVVLAEGAEGALRNGLGIAADGPGLFDEVDEILLRCAALDQFMADVPGDAFVCTAAGAMVFRRDLRRWQISRSGRPFSDTAASVHAAVGRPIDFELVSRTHWRPVARLAETLCRGNVALVGDAAHTMPPSLGLGGNAAIADAYSLAPRLAAVLAGRAGRELLEEYSAERRAAGRELIDRSVAALQSSRPGSERLDEGGVGGGQ